LSARSRPVAVIAALTVAALLAATAAAMVITQHLRDEGPVASSIHWKTRLGPRYRVCFRLTKEDQVRVTVVDSEDRQVKLLAETRLRGGDTPHCFDWDGRADSGQPVPPGRYHLQLGLRKADRVAVSGERLRIYPINVNSGSSSGVKRVAPDGAPSRQAEGPRTS
jgi:FlgD Ig-like domain